MYFDLTPFQALPLPPPRSTSPPTSLHFVTVLSSLFLSNDLEQVALCLAALVLIIVSPCSMIFPEL